MPSSAQKNKNYSHAVKYTKMTEEELNVAKDKLDIANSTQEQATNECQSHSCKEKGTEKCEYCNKFFCKHHALPVISTSFSFIQALHSEDDYEKWKKYNDDWKRQDGHPCPAYTGWWNRDHDAKVSIRRQNVNARWAGGGGRAYRPSSNSRYTGGEYRSNGTADNNMTTSDSPKSSRKKVLAILIVLLTIVLIILYLESPNVNVSSTPIVIANNSANLTSAILSNATNQTVPTTGVTTSQPSQSSTIALQEYVLSLINTDRNQNGLSNVSLSNETSGQQHAESMLNDNYFSHWDIYGLKPYMRYTLLNGTGAVSENIAYQFDQICSITCSGDINPKTALQEMEYNMMYNDSICCNNGHRDNILNPDHNQVSIGIATDGSRIYLVEDFIDNYINWTNNAPELSIASDEMYLSGKIQKGYAINQVSVSYDPPVENMSSAQLNSTFSYGYGTQIAGVATDGYYYTTMTTINADQYSVEGNQFTISFNLRSLIQQNGAGEYTILVWLNDSKGNTFVGSTYTIFVNRNLQPYIPQNI